MAAAESTTFLLELATALHAAYLPVNEVERRVRECAKGLGVEAEPFTLQSVAMIGGRSAGARLLRMEFSPHWNLTRLHHLLGLCGEVAAGRKGLAAAQEELTRIEAMPKRYGRRLVLLGYVVYGAAVAARVGGHGWEILAAALLGLVAGAIHQGTTRFPTFELEKSLLAGFAGTLAAFLLRFVLPPFDAERAIFGAMTLLVPAMVVTIGVVEVASEEAGEAGIARLIYGLFRFLMLALGIVAAGKVWTLFAPLPEMLPAHPLPKAAVAAILVPGGLALMLCVQARPRDAAWMVAAVLFAWGTQELTRLLFGERGSPFLAAFALGLFAFLYARRPGRVPATLVFPGLLQLVPGFLGTQSVVALLRPGQDDSANFFRVLLVGLQLTVGLMAALVLVRGRRGTGQVGAG
jgi:uncharacterized membrane protein YjjP (DUF1212 family)